MTAPETPLRVISPSPIPRIPPKPAEATSVPKKVSSADCTSLAGVPKEEWSRDYIYDASLDAYRLNREGSRRYIKNDAVWLNLGESSETLTGAMITLMDGVRNVINWGYTLEEAATMSTLTPAKNLGVDSQKGSIAPGKDADLVILDADFNVKTVIIEGVILKQD